MAFRPSCGFSRGPSRRLPSAVVRRGAGLIGRGHVVAGVLLLTLGAGAFLWQERGAAEPEVAEPKVSTGHAPARGAEAALAVAGTVTHCFDGDSFRMATAQGEQEVRLWGVDAPEHGQPFGEEAKAFAKSHWEGRAVEVVADHGTDRYGRRILEIRLKEGPLLQRLLLDQGCAWHYRQYAGDRRDFAEAEAAARRKRAGLWSRKNPTPPWEWRREHPK